jgi:hypothetical protein
MVIVSDGERKKYEEHVKSAAGYKRDQLQVGQYPGFLLGHPKIYSYFIF